MSFSKFCFHLFQILCWCLVSGGTDRQTRLRVQERQMNHSHDYSEAAFHCHAFETGFTFSTVSENIMILELNGPIGPLNSRPCGQLVTLRPTSFLFYLVGHQGLPFGHQGLPFGHQSLPFGHQYSDCM